MFWVQEAELLGSEHPQTPSGLEAAGGWVTRAPTARPAGIYLSAAIQVMLLQKVLGPHPPDGNGRPRWLGEGGVLMVGITKPQLCRLGGGGRRNSAGGGQRGREARQPVANVSIPVTGVTDELSSRGRDNEVVEPGDGWGDLVHDLVLEPAPPQPGSPGPEQTAAGTPGTHRQARVRAGSRHPLALWPGARSFSWTLAPTFRGGDGSLPPRP